MNSIKSLIENKATKKNLDDFFNSLQPVYIPNMIGNWQGGYFKIKNSWLEFLLNDYYIIKWHGKIFKSENNVKALITKFLGIKFNMLLGKAVLRQLEYRGKVSTSMIYNYLPIIDNFRKVDDKTVMGIMDIKGKDQIYFYLIKE